MQKLLRLIRSHLFIFAFISNILGGAKQLEKEEVKNPRVSRRKEILKIRAEINAKETKETIVKINKAKSWFFENRLKRLLGVGCHCRKRQRDCTKPTFWQQALPNGR